MPKISVYMLHIKKVEKFCNEASAGEKSVKWYNFGNFPLRTDLVANGTFSIAQITQHGMR
jgi:hypothetical protein